MVISLEYRCFMHFLFVDLKNQLLLFEMLCLIHRRFLQVVFLPLIFSSIIQHRIIMDVALHEQL